MIFVLIVLLAGILRLIFLQTIEFKTDESINLFLAARPLFGHFFLPGSTVSSFGILNPPLFIYLLFPATLFSLDPRVVSGYIGLINAFAIGFFYLFTKKYYGKIVALFAAVLLATSPWSIIFSRKIWAQDFVVPLSIPLFFSIHKILLDKQSKYWTLYILSAFFLLQIHQATIFFLFPLTIFLLISKPVYNIRAILTGFALGLLPLAPYIFFEFTHGFYDISQIMASVGRVSDVRHLAVFVRPFQIMGQGNFYYLFGDDIPAFVNTFPFIYAFRLLFYLEYPLLMLGMVIFFFQHKRFRLLIYSVIILPCLYYLLKIEPQMHYFLILTPLLFLFMGVGLGYLWQGKSPKFTKMIIAGGVIVICFASIVYIVSFFIFVDQKKGLKGDYGATYAYGEKLVKQPLEKYKNTAEYNEMLLAGYIPAAYMRGTTTVAKMLYNFSETKNNLPSLDKRIKQVSEDARVANELLAYYTRTVPTEKTLKELRQKSQESPSYRYVHTQAYQIYLENKFRKAYASSVYGIAFEYPQHWTLETNKKATTIALKGDGLVISFLPKDDQKNNIEETVCTNNQKQWCGTIYSILDAKNNPFIITIMPDSMAKPLAIDSSDYHRIKGIEDIILKSLRLQE